MFDELLPSLYTELLASLRWADINRGSIIVKKLTTTRKYKMTKEPFFICDCGSTILAVSHTWTNKTDLEEVGFVGEGGSYEFDEPAQLKLEELDHQWIAYCGGCGKGVTAEWLDEGRVRVIMGEEKE
jgi:hypothetical protein